MNICQQKDIDIGFVVIMVNGVLTNYLGKVSSKGVGSYDPTRAKMGRAQLYKLRRGMRYCTHVEDIENVRPERVAGGKSVAKEATSSLGLEDCLERLPRALRAMNRRM